MKRLGLIAILLGAPNACGRAPCMTLSERICSCAESTLEQESCMRRLQSLVSNDTAQATTPTPAQEERCISLLTTCSCEALARGDLAACGLTLPE